MEKNIRRGIHDENEFLCKSAGWGICDDCNARVTLIYSAAGVTWSSLGHFAAATVFYKSVTFIRLLPTVASANAV